MRYGETLWSELYEGSRPSISCMQPAVLAVEKALDLAPKTDLSKKALDLASSHRKRTVWRMDGGFGCDDKLRWLLDRNYQLVVKGFSGQRAYNLAKQVKRWDRYGDSWLGQVVCPINFEREVFCWVKKYPKGNGVQHSYYLTTLKLPAKTFAMNAYNQRGGAEIEQFRHDKQGLHFSARRKRIFLAQKALVLLNDLAHNLIADFYHTALIDTPFSAFRHKRIVRDLFSIEGRIEIKDNHLYHIFLAQNHPYSEAFLPCLLKYCST